MAWTTSNPVAIGAATKKSDYDKLWDNADYLMSAFDAAGDMAYASAANTIAKLSAGAANLKLFMNAGATAPEWAAGNKLVSFTHVLDWATQDQAITGVGFKPSSIIAIGYSSINYSLSVGICDVFLTQACVSQFADAFVGGDTANILQFRNTGDVVYIKIKSYDASDGFTITWTRSGNPLGGSGYAHFLCFR